MAPRSGVLPRVLLFCAIAVCVGGLAACRSGEVERTAMRITGGQPDRGRRLVRWYGCGTCHHISGVPGAEAVIGPPLDDIANRAYLAGRLPNNPDNMLLWIMHPQHIDPHTVMPEMGVTARDGRDISAYLYTLQ